MDYEDIRLQANDIGTKSGIAAGLCALLVAISLESGIPPFYIWLGSLVFGVFVQQAIGVAVLVWLTKPAETPTPEPVVVPHAAEEMPVSAPVSPLLAAVLDAGHWAKATHWDELADYAATPGAILSRAGVSGMVDQRFYSPREGDSYMPGVSFPELMVQIGAAVRVNSAGNGVSYTWTPRAPGLLREVSTLVASPHPADVFMALAN